MKCTLIRKNLLVVLKVLARISILVSFVIGLLESGLREPNTDLVFIDPVTEAEELATDVLFIHRPLTHDLSLDLFFTSRSEKEEG
jgi:hypothetical protein